MRYRIVSGDEVDETSLFNGRPFDDRLFSERYRYRRSMGPPHRQLAAPLNSRRTFEHHLGTTQTGEIRVFDIRELVAVYTIRSCPVYIDHLNGTIPERMLLLLYPLVHTV